MNPDQKQFHIKKELPKCKVNSCLKRGNFENGICPKCTTTLNKVSKRNKPLKKQSDSGWSKAFRECKTSFQKLRRLQEMDENGICKCVNGELKHWTKCDSGHWLPAQYKSTCFESMNVHPQSKVKNMNMNDPVVSGEYTAYMINRYGADEVEKLIQRSKQTRKYSTFELMTMKIDFDNQINEILKTIK